MSGGAHLRRLAAALVVALVVGGLHVHPPPPLRHLDAGIYDLLLRLTHQGETSGRLVVIELDERSLSEFGRWPWPRSRLARLLDKIRAQRPASIALEMLFPEPDEPTSDRALADVLRTGPFAVGYAFTFAGDPAGRTGCVLQPMAVAVRHPVGDASGADALFEASGAVCSLDAIAAAAPRAGFLNATPDADGILRRVPQLIGYDGRIYPSLALAALLQTWGPVPIVLEIAGDVPRSLQIGDKAIPIDPRGNLLVHFRGGRRRFPYVSAADVLADHLSPGTLRGRIVFVGASALGIRKVVATPLDPLFPGVEVHTTVVDNILRGDFLRRPDWATGLELSLVLGLAVGNAWLLGRFGSAGGALAGAGVATVLWGACAWVLRASGVVVSPLFPSLALVGSFAVVTVLNVAVERRRAEHGARSLATAGTLMLQALTSLTEIRKEKQRLGHALRESEAGYRSLFENAPIGLYQSAADGRLVDANPTLVRILGYPNREALLAANLSDLEVDPPARARGQARPELVDLAPDAERRWRRWDGTVVWVKTNDRVVHDTNGSVRGYAGAVEDITERKQAEEAREHLEAQLRQAQKMEALGRLAGGVAHDFNNMLTVIEGRGRIILDLLGPEHPLRHQVELIRQAADRAAALTRQLLAFSRQQALKPKVLDVNQELMDAHNMLTRLLREDIALELRCDAQLGMVQADPGQLHQIILNLAVNARDAMPQGGRLVLETANVDLDGAFAARNRGARSGPYVSLTVRDTGVGMDGRTLAHCFEPFFTTKGLGQGTGLGLSTVYGIVKQHDGYVRVDSAPGEGTTFTVYLPRVDALTEPERGPGPSWVGAHGRERILLVEDEAAVRNVTREMLEAAGFTVLVAQDGAEALRLADSDAGAIDLLLTDVVMPGLNGRDLAQLLRNRRPGLRVLYMSGYTDDAIVGQGVLAPDTALLDKPFSSEALIGIVHAVLEGQPLPRFRIAGPDPAETGRSAHRIDSEADNIS